MILAPSIRTQPCKRVRSTLLVGSLQALRARGHGDTYLRHVAPEVVQMLSAVGAPQWLSVETALAHYEACEALRLPSDEVLAIGALVAPMQASGVRVVLRAVRTGGATPWTALGSSSLYWSRMYDGSAIHVVKTGPKDAMLAIEGNPLSRFAYWRVGLRGIIGELARALATYALAREVKCDPARDSVTYSLSWV